MGQITREQWLVEMIQFFKPEFSRLGYPIDNKKIGVTIGFPSSRARIANRKRIGEVWSDRCSRDGYHQVMVSPCVKNSIEAASVLLHELVHIAVGLEHGHRKPFRDCALAVGLAGQMRATVPGEKLNETLQTIITVLGEIPHGELVVNDRPRQPTRMKKVVCPDCGYTIRVSTWWLLKGCPTCVCGTQMEQAEVTETLKGSLK